MTLDAHTNFGSGVVAVAPVTPIAGVTMTVNLDPGVVPPVTPFNFVSAPPNVKPTAAIAEISRCTNIAGNVWTIVRHQENTSARIIAVGDLIYIGFTAKTLTDIESAIALLAPLDSAVLTGSPTAPTKTALDSSTKLSTTKYTDDAVAIEKVRALAVENGMRGLTHGRAVASLPARAPLLTVAPNTIFAGRMQLTAYVSMGGIRFVYAGMANGEILPDNEVLIEAAIEYLGVRYQMTFGGQRFGTLDRFGILTSDPALIDIPIGALYYALTRMLAPNNAANLNPLNGYTPLAADVTLGATSITVVDLPPVRNNMERFRLTGAGSEVVEVVRWSGAASPYTAFLRSALVANHVAAGSGVGQGTWLNREVYSDQGGTPAQSGSNFDLLTGVFTAASPSGSTTLAAAANIGDTSIQVVAMTPMRGQTWTLDTAGNAETIVARTVTSLVNPFTVYLTTPLTKAHASGATLANTNSGGIFIPVPTAVTADYSVGSPTPILLLGDSIMGGTGNNFRQWESYATLALDATHPILQMSKGGESAQQMAANTNGFMRRRLFDFGKWLFLGYGTNDIYSGRTLAQWQADMITICGWARQRNMKIAMATILPRTTGPDFTSIIGQAISNPTFDAIRILGNQWIRSGASGFCDLAVDVANAVEVNSSNVLTQNGGLWKADANPGPYTVDWLHPSYSGHQLMAAAINPALFV